MAENKKIDWNALGQAMDSTWGRSSQEKEASFSDPEEREPTEWTIVGRSKSSGFASHSVKATFMDAGHIQLKYGAVVNFGSENERLQMARKWEDEAKQVMNDALKKIKEVYKEFSGETIALKETSAKDSIEIISGLLHNPRQTAYYRRIAVVEVK